MTTPPLNSHHPHRDPFDDVADLSQLPLFHSAQSAATDRDVEALRTADHAHQPNLTVDTGIQAVPPEHVDWTLVAGLRSQASELLSQAVSAEHGLLDQPAQQELGRGIVIDLVESAMAERIDVGSGAWTDHQRHALAQAVFDALFRLGRLQPLVDDDRVENIIIAGHDRVRLELVDGSLVAGPPVAESDEELIDFLVFLASRSEVNARAFSEAQPRLHLRLDGGARLAAAAWVTPRPSIVIRRHRLRDVTLEDLVVRGAMTSVAASFLRAAVRARKSIVVSGSQGAGKTTLVRALCAEIDRHEALGTFETEYELHLHELDRHEIVHAWEARPGSGERGPGGRLAGEFTLDDALFDSFRFNLSRQIVGEVRGREIWTMIKAMESGTGSISTTHASDGIAAIRKLVTCAMEAGPHVTQELATSKLAATVDLVVHLELSTASTSTTGGAPGRSRRIAEIIAVAPGEREAGFATTHVFRSSGVDLTAPSVLPESYRALAAHGFDLNEYLATSREPLGRTAGSPS